MQWLDIYDALTEYDEGLREYFHKDVPMFPRDESKVPKGMKPEDYVYEAPPPLEETKTVDYSHEVADIQAKADKALEMKSFNRAVDLYSKALLICDTDKHILLSNRSKALLELKKHSEAISDANECIRLRPDWIEGYQRKGAVLIDMDRKFEAIPIISVACDLQPKDNMSAVLLTRAVEMKDDTTHLYRVLNASRFRKYERFLDLVCVAMRDVLERAPFPARTIYDEHGEPVPTKSPETQLMFAMQHAKRLIRYLPKLGHPSLDKHVKYFSSLLKRYEPMIGKIGTLLSQYSQTGVPVDVLQKIGIESGPKKSLKAAKKGVGGNPKKKKRNKEKLKALKSSATETKRVKDADELAAALRYSLSHDELFIKMKRGENVHSPSPEPDSNSEASISKPEASALNIPQAAAALFDESDIEFSSEDYDDPKMMFASCGQDGLDKVVSSMKSPERIDSFAKGKNPMRKHGLSDEYMEQLQAHFARNVNRQKGDPLTSEEIEWAKLRYRNPHDLTTEELHKLLTIQGVCVMGDISREKLLSFARKTQGIEHLPPLEKLNKFVDNPDSDDVYLPTVDEMMKQEKEKLENEKHQKWDNTSESEKIRIEERKMRSKKYIERDTDDPANWTEKDFDDMVSSTLERDLFKALYESDQKKRQVVVAKGTGDTDKHQKQPQETNKKQQTGTSKRKDSKSDQRNTKSATKGAKDESKTKTSMEEKASPAVKDEFKDTQSSQKADNPSKTVKLCAHCKSSKPKMLKCGRCLTVHYCDRECQKADYPEHKKTCQKK
jgi:tetratricopeptide (TPR) repeat protein